MPCIITKFLEFLSFPKKLKFYQLCPSRNLQTMNIITTAQGKLRGEILNLPSGEKYASFRGIPYAKPPLGNLRFKAPSSPEPWSGIRDATQHGPVCPQFDIFTQNKLEGDENCLHLNIYSKVFSSKRELYPVMFWIHGGGYMSGNGNDELYGPEYLVEHDVVLVTVNYRLEALGFLCLDNEEVPGNAGLKDQAAALKWVKENILSFGGDPDNITIFGESAGGSSVTFHLVSPMTRGLYHKAIAQSGAFTCDWSYSVDGKERAFRLGKLLGKDTNDTQTLLEYLQSIPATRLIHVTNKTMTQEERMKGLPIHFCPVMEKPFDNVEPFFKEDFLTSLNRGHLEHVPFIIGYNSAEGLLSVRDALKKKDFLNNNFYSKVPREIFNAVPKRKSDIIGKKIKEFYFNGDDVSKKKVREICNMESDILFTYNCHRFADIYSKMNVNAVFMYIFSCVSDINLTKMSLGLTQQEGACHADDIFYLFKNSALHDTVQNDPKIKEFVYRMTKMWTNFAKHGNPTPDDSLGVTWPRYEADSKMVLNIGDTLTVDKPNLQVLQFWTTIYREMENNFKSKL